VADDGTVACRGWNNHGQLGDGTTTDSSVKVSVTTVGTGLAGKLVKAVSAGAYHTCALATDATAACWGYNAYGQLGTGTTTASNVPVAVTATGALAGKTLTAITAGFDHTCAVASDGTAACWGYNAYGHLGNGTTTTSSVPVAVAGSAATTAGGGLARPVLAIAAGNSVTAAIYAYASTPGAPGIPQITPFDASWGNNTYGQLGNGTNTDSSVPVAVAGGHGRVLAIATGGWQNAVIYGSVLSWAPPVFAGNPALASYWVFYKPVGQTTWKAYATGVSATSLNLSTLNSGDCLGAATCPLRYGAMQVGIAYEFRVIAATATNKQGRWSNASVYTWNG
jgi:hypothetical protein